MSGILEQLRPEVRSYRHGGYRLAHDLESLERTLSASAREGTIFYAARVLEALSGAALDAIGLKGKDNPFSNLSRLQEYGLLPHHTLYWAHALRRAGNSVRHAETETSPEQEETAVAFLGYWLRWFFCGFAFGARLPDITTRPGRSPFVRDSDLSRVLGMIESKELDPSSMAREVVEGQYEKVRGSPAVLAVLAERLLQADRLVEAETFLDWAAREHGGDPRLQQLRGLSYSRAGRLDEALGVLEPWYKRYRTDDEMIGIMAGIYKRKWRASPEERSWLAKSHRTYESGWKQDRDNAYLGINVATTALLLGNPERSAEVATDVRDVLLKREEVLGRLDQHGRPPLGLWDRLTLVEAELLLRNFDSATREFAEAGRSYADAIGSLTVARQQFLEIAERLDAPDGMFPDSPRP